MLLLELKLFAELIFIELFVVLLYDFTLKLLEILLLVTVGATIFDFVSELLLLVVDGAGGELYPLDFEPPSSYAFAVNTS